MEDIAIMTGARPFVQERMVPLHSVRLEDLGHADKVTVTRDYTTILGGGGMQSLIQNRISELRSTLNNTKSDYDREKIQERIAKMVSGVAVIKIGGITDADRTERTYRLESAMFSAHTAIENGFASGGGVEYLRARPFVEKLLPRNEEEQAGIAAVANALEQPLRQLLANSRPKDTEKLVNDIRDSDPYRRARPTR